LNAKPNNLEFACDLDIDNNAFYVYQIGESAATIVAGEEIEFIIGDIDNPNREAGTIRIDVAASSTNNKAFFFDHILSGSVIIE